ncbi:MAG: winged helix-turn-helix domain-containing protein [Chloroflexota bacterium]
MEQLLHDGATTYGFQGDVWTQPRVAKVIEQTFGVAYTPGHVGRLLKRMGWTRQKPVTRATQCDEQAIEAWRTQRWPELEKKPGTKDEQ